MYYCHVGFVICFVGVLLEGPPVAARSEFSRLREEGPLATYCVDPQVLELFNDRVSKCLEGRTVTEEIGYLKKTSVFHYQKAHELFAFDYFATWQLNPRRTHDCRDSAFEYVPLLPLAWKVEFPVRTECTAGDVCPRQALSHDACSSKNLVKDILKYIAFIRRERGHSLHQGTQRFIVTGAFNLKTILGRGMTTIVRRGEEYELISTFIETTILGHYERLIQCADLLRKPWKYVVEMPYVSLLAGYSRLQSQIQCASSAHGSQLLRRAQDLTARSNIKFFFSGRLKLWGSERVCSVRVAMLQLLGRNDTVVVDIDTQQSEGVPLRSSALYDTISASEFCLILRADSYSTASFYEAIASLCIPVVVSDWFVFSYRWWVPYEEFVIRVAEADFLADPHSVLDYVSTVYSTSRIRDMKSSISKWRKSFSYQPDDSKFLYPLELLVMEMQKADAETKVLPIKNPTIKPGDINRLATTGPALCLNPQSCTPTIFPLPLRGKVKDTRQHLCRHSDRLIGKYKIVYFLQCVRMFWTLRPGLMKPVDDTISVKEKSFVYRFHNLSTDSTFEWDVYPNGSNGNTADNAVDANKPVYRTC